MNSQTASTCNPVRASVPTSPATQTKARANLPPPSRLWPVAVLVCCLTFVVQGYAQFFPGQFGGGGNASRRSNSSSSSRQYPVNGTVGDAVFSVDPETRSLIVIADDQTAEEMPKSCPTRSAQPQCVH